jgi:hypothetical protein
LLHYDLAVGVNNNLINLLAIQQGLHNVVEEWFSCEIPVIFSRYALAGVAHWYNGG